MRKTTRHLLLGVLAVAVLLMALPAMAAATPPTGDDGPFVCPSVSLNNANGMWVIGDHGAYWVLVPNRGSTSDKVFVKDPKNMEAQTTAGYGLYKDYPSYPDYVTQTGDMGAVLLVEGLHWFPGAPDTWGEGDMLVIHDNGNGTYHVMNMGNPMMGAGPKGDLTINGAVPLWSAVFW
jgi:hypothetical protein